MTVPMAPEIDTEQEVILLKIERINENQIRCTLTSFDLSVRNLNLVELAYGTEKARKLFREMIQKAEEELRLMADYWREGQPWTYKRKRMALEAYKMYQAAHD
jgi:adapter protein MecA 1/2